MAKTPSPSPCALIAPSAHLAARSSVGETSIVRTSACGLGRLRRQVWTSLFTQREWTVPIGRSTTTGNRCVEAQCHDQASRTRAWDRGSAHQCRQGLSPGPAAASFRRHRHRLQLDTARRLRRPEPLFNRPESVASGIAEGHRPACGAGDRRPRQDQ